MEYLEIGKNTVKTVPYIENSKQAKEQQNALTSANQEMDVTVFLEASDPQKPLQVLVHWVGSCPEQYDIISSADLVLDNMFDSPGLLEPDALVMVKCGYAKSPAYIVSISDDTDYLTSEMKRLMDKARNIEPVITNNNKNNSLVKKDKENTNESKDVDTINISADEENRNIYKENLKTKVVRSIKRYRSRSKSAGKDSAIKKMPKITGGFRRTVRDKIVKYTSDSDYEIENETSVNMMYTKLKAEYTDLQIKYSALKNTYDDMRSNLKALIENTDVSEKQNASDDGQEYIENLTPRAKRSLKKSSNKTPLRTLNEDNKIIALGINGIDPNRKCSEIILSDKVLIGSGRTMVPRNVYNQINWHSFTAATRKLLMATFPRDVLGTRTLTGKPSPAFIDTGITKLPKMRLDPKKVNDIIETVSVKCGVTPSLVRNAITTKCADENKMFKKRALKENQHLDFNHSIIGKVEEV